MKDFIETVYSLLRVVGLNNDSHFCWSEEVPHFIQYENAHTEKLKTYKKEESTRSKWCHQSDKPYKHKEPPYRFTEARTRGAVNVKSLVHN